MRPEGWQEGEGEDPALRGKNGAFLIPLPYPSVSLLGMQGISISDAESSDEAQAGGGGGV